MSVEIAHLHRSPQRLAAVATLVFDEFWAGVEGGHTEASLAEAFGRASDPQRMPLSLIALDGDALVGCVHLIDNDDRTLPELHPWLAALVVVPARRGQGIGSALVKAMAAEARRLGHAQLYFGTDGPGFYERLGAVRHLARGPGFWIMRLPLG